MIRSTYSLIGWLLHIFNPPPLASMTEAQKVNRSLLVTLAIVVNCILLAMLLALGIYLYERSQRILREIPELTDALGILAVSIGVNIICVLILFQVKKADRKLMDSVPQKKTET